MATKDEKAAKARKRVAKKGSVSTHMLNSRDLEHGFLNNTQSLNQSNHIHPRKNQLIADDPYLFAVQRMYHL
jgi:hypothetical protein